MSNPILSAFLKAAGGVAVDVARMNLPASNSKPKPSSCTPCAVKARVEAAKRMARGGK